MGSIRSASNMAISKKIYIQRDYSDGMVPKFQYKLPRELDELIAPAVFQKTIETLNKIYADAEGMTLKTYWEGCFSCLTGYLFLGCMNSQYHSNLKKVKSFLRDENEKVYWPKGVIIMDPYPSGLRSIEVVIYKSTQ